MCTAVPKCIDSVAPKKARLKSTGSLNFSNSGMHVHRRPCTQGPTVIDAHKA